MLRYKTETRPGLVALYDIRPGNGVGQFLQPGARTGRNSQYHLNTCVLQILMLLRNFLFD